LLNVATKIVNNLGVAGIVAGFFMFYYVFLSTIQILKPLKPLYNKAFKIRLAKCNKAIF
jgi:hypothetical protein